LAKAIPERDGSEDGSNMMDYRAVRSAAAAASSVIVIQDTGRKKV